jgi:mono/diheme cytochrome c family protein
MLVIDGMPFMKLPAPNLTRGRGGIGATFTDTDWVRVLRHGVSPDGRKLAMMPSEAYTHMDDADLGAVIAYIKAVPPVDREFPAKEYGPIARALLVAGQFPMHVYDQIDHSRRTVIARTAESDTVGYGRYLAVIGGCSICHGANLAGGRGAGGPPDGPIPSNLTPAGIGHYTEADFLRVLREGLKPGGVAVDSAMPWRASGRMTDAEIHSVWTFLRSLPPVETPPATR